MVNQQLMSGTIQEFFNIKWVLADVVGDLAGGQESERNERENEEEKREKNEENYPAYSLQDYFHHLENLVNQNTGYKAGKSHFSQETPTPPPEVFVN